MEPASGGKVSQKTRPPGPLHRQRQHSYEAEQPKWADASEVVETGEPTGTPTDFPDFSASSSDARGRYSLGRPSVSAKCPSPEVTLCPLRRATFLGSGGFRDGAVDRVSADPFKLATTKKIFSCLLLRPMYPTIISPMWQLGRRSTGGVHEESRRGRISARQNLGEAESGRGGPILNKVAALASVRRLASAVAYPVAYLLAHPTRLASPLLWA